MNTEPSLTNGNIDSSDESIAYWAKQMQCTEKDLINAVYQIGNNYNVLVMYLEMNHKIHREEIFYIVEPKKDSQ